jgi:hypothetical protein
MQVLFEMILQIKQKRGIGVENPSPRSFSGGHTKGLLVCTPTNTQTKKKELKHKRGGKKETERMCLGGGLWE